MYPQQTPPALIPQPPQKPEQTMEEKSMGRRIRYAVLAGIAFFVLSMPVAYRASNSIWSIFSTVPLIGKAMMVPMMVEHPNGYKVQQMVERPCEVGMRAIAFHAGLVVAIMFFMV